MAPEGNAQEDKSDIAKVNLFMAKVTLTIENHEKAMNQILVRYNVFADDDPDILEQQELALQGDLAFVPNQQQAAVQEALESIIKDALPKPAPNAAITPETVASGLVRNNMRNKIVTIAMNPKAILNTDGTLNNDFQQSFKAQVQSFHQEFVQLASEFRAMPSKQQHMLQSAFSVLLTTSSVNTQRSTPGFDSHVRQQDQGARPYQHPKPSFANNKKEDLPEPGYKAPPAPTDIPRSPGSVSR